MEAQICDAEERHIPQIEEIEKLCFSVPWTRDQLCSQLHDAQHECIAALDGEDNVLGYVGMMCVLDEGYISNVAVHPKVRRHGLADKLIDELLSRARGRSLAFVTLEVRAGNEPAIALYRKHGFLPVGRRKNYYSLPREDAILMTNTLE